jgi:hypothetical protein
MTAIERVASILGLVKPLGSVVLENYNWIKKLLE